MNDKDIDLLLSLLLLLANSEIDQEIKRNAKSLFNQVNVLRVSAYDNLPIIKR